jgi:hypothetical protein
LLPAGELAKVGSWAESWYDLITYLVSHKSFLIRLVQLLTIRFLQHVPQSQHSRFWERIVYVDMAGTNGVGWPLYYQLGNESLWEVSERYVQCIQMTSPSLLTAQYYGWPPLHKIGVYTGMVLYALGLQIPSAIDLLRQPDHYLAQLQAAPGHFPEVSEAVAFFTKEYLPASRTARERLTTSFLDKIFPFALDEGLRAVVGAAVPGINWDEVARKHQTVLLDFRNVHNQELRRFLLLWSFLYLFEWIKRRGRSSQPFAVCFDEFVHITRAGKAGSDGSNPLADLFDEFINVYMRNHNSWFSCAFQELFQLDEQLRNTILSLGTYIIGRQSNPEACRVIADYLFKSDPFLVKHWQRVWGRPDPYGFLAVIDWEPEFLPMPEQLELAAQMIRELPRFAFLVRPAVGEGEVSTNIIL